MSEILKLYRKKIMTQPKSIAREPQSLLSMQRPSYDTIFSNQTLINLLDNRLTNSALPQIYDREYDTSPIVDRYINYDPLNYEGGNLLDVYYKTYGYNALAATMGGYLLGTFDATRVLQSGLSLLIPGSSRGGINSFLLNAANIALRHPLIENTINNFLPSPFNLQNDSNIKWQSLPSEYFYMLNPPSLDVVGAGAGNIALQIGGSALLSLFNSTISGVANSGHFTAFDWERAFGKGLDTAEVILLASAGIKYTRAVAWFDPSMPKWSDQPGYHTYDKYIAYSDGVLVYSTAKEAYGDTMLNRYNNLGEYNIEIPRFLPGNMNTPINPALPALPGIPPITNPFNKASAANAKSYQQSLGQIPSADEDPSIKYSNDPDIRAKINRLGFPQFNASESKVRGSSEYIDKINMLDVGQDYPEDVADTIIFKFEDISSISGSSTPIIFRAAITGLSDKINPTWTDTKYLGRADTFYTYEGVTRDISFSIFVYNNSVEETSTQWRKINRLVGLCYPVAYSGNRAMKSPIIRLTIGDLYRRIYGFISSLDVSVSDDTLWDINVGNQFPHYVEISVSFTMMYLGDGSGAPYSNSAHFNQGGKLYNGSKITLPENRT